MNLRCIQIFVTMLTLGQHVALAQDDELRGIRGLAVDSFWEANWQWAAPLCVLVAAIVIALCVVLYKRLRRPATVSAREQAMRQLAEARALLEEESPEANKAFAVSVSQALRGYLERAVGLRAPEQTTEEFLQAAQSSQKIESEALKSLEAFLKLCDLAKFARHAFGQHEREQLYSTAKAFVEEQDRKPNLPETAQ